MKRLLLDMDGVITNHTKQFAKYNNATLLEIPGEYAFEKILPGVKNVWEHVDYNFWATMEKMPDADEIVSTIKNYFPLNRICICTMFPTMWGYPVENIGDCLLGKMEWLKNNFPEFLNHFLIGPSKFFCAGPDTVLIDDYDTGVDEFEQFGGHGMILPRMWNRLYPMRDKVVPYLDCKLRMLLMEG